MEPGVGINLSKILRRNIQRFRLRSYRKCLLTYVDLATLLRADLIVVSTHNYPWFKRLMTGSDADKIARHAPCPILIVHPREHDSSISQDHQIPRDKESF